MILVRLRLFVIVLYLFAASALSWGRSLRYTYHAIEKSYPLQWVHTTARSSWDGPSPALMDSFGDLGCYIP